MTAPILRYDSLARAGPMQTSSSANFTCRESLSASEWTATVRIPSSRQAHTMRRAISPLLAIRIFLNMSGVEDPDAEENLSVFHGLAVAHRNLQHLAGHFEFQLVHELH